LQELRRYLAHTVTGGFDNDPGVAAQLDAAVRELHRRARLTADVLERHVTAVLTLHDDGNPEFVGSGLYMRLGDRFYLVTAAHVLDLCECGVYLPHLAHLGDPLSGAMVVTGKPPGQSRARDPFDIGFVRLSAAEASEIGYDKFRGPPQHNRWSTEGASAHDDRVGVSYA